MTVSLKTHWCLPRKFPDSGKKLADGEMKRLVENEDKQVFGKSLMFRVALGFILSHVGDGR